MLAGDSAGGNLTLAVLSHISQPHPQVPKLEFEGNFRAAILISPWLKFDFSADSFIRNQNKDVCAVVDKWSEAFLGEAKTDPYNQPFTAPADWWRGLRVEEVLIVAGSDEIYIDDIKTFAESFEVCIPLCCSG